MNALKVVGLVLLVLGAVFLFFGVNATGTFGEKVTEGLTGEYTDGTMKYLIGGALCGAAGVGLMVFGGRKG